MDVDVTSAIETQIVIFYGTTYNKHMAIPSFLATFLLMTIYCSKLPCQ